MDSRLRDRQSRLMRRSLCRIFTGRGRGTRLNLVLPRIGRRLCMDGMTEKGTNIVVAQGQSRDLDKMIDTPANHQVLIRWRTIYTYLAQDLILEIDIHLDTMIEIYLDMMIEIHLDMMTDIAQEQDQDHEKEDLHRPVIENTGVTTAHLHRIYPPSHLNGIKISHHQ
jgi:hypothetical protein